MDNKMDAFKKEYNELKDYLIKQAGTLIRDRKNFDKDELLGIATVLAVKTNNFMNSAIDIVEWQNSTLATLQLAEEHRAKENYEIKNVLILINDKIENLDAKFDSLKKKEAEKVEKKEK